MQLCFFPDNSASNFLPLTLTRPLFDLRIGILTIKEKWFYSLSPTSISGIIEPYLQSLFPVDQLDFSTYCLWINSRFVPSPDLLSEITRLPKDTTLEHNGSIVAANLSGAKSEELLSSGEFKTSKLNRIQLSPLINPISISYLWDLLSLNAKEIEQDLDLLSNEIPSSSTLSNNCIASNPENIFISADATIEPGCILIADKGSIFIGPKATIEAGSILRGPVAVCEGATVKMRARLSEATTVGPFSKVGGEVSNCIFHSYSNKAHDGFTGNSVFGQWCNLGADTNTSNLKNNYSEVKLQDWITKYPSDKGVQFLGTIMGDHSKTAINTMLNTGTICGVSANIFTSGFPRKYIPSFSWVGDDEVQIYNFEKAIDAMSAMMKRRNIELSNDYKNMMIKIFELSTNI